MTVQVAAAAAAAAAAATAEMQSMRYMMLPPLVLLMMMVAMVTLASARHTIKKCVSHINIQSLIIHVFIEIPHILLNARAPLTTLQAQSSPWRLRVAVMLQILETHSKSSFDAVPSLLRKKRGDSTDSLAWRWCGVPNLPVPALLL